MQGLNAQIQHFREQFSTLVTPMGVPLVVCDSQCREGHDTLVINFEGRTSNGLVLLHQDRFFDSAKAEKLLAMVCNSDFVQKMIDLGVFNHSWPTTLTLIEAGSGALIQLSDHFDTVGYWNTVSKTYREA